MSESVFSVSQLIGYVAFICGVFAFTQRDDRRLKVSLIVQSLVYGIHFFLLGNLAACASNGVSIVRNLASLRTRSRYAAAGLFLIALLAGYFTVHGPLGLLTIGAAFISIYGMFWLDGIALRICLFCCTILWLTNNILSHSYGGTALEFTIGATNLITIMRMKRDAVTAAAVS
ncbi:MAG: YgjV family protein [Capsulimonadaceae bacterium]|nr:YgjV family protein [Capsulimonadaceae bacterium]